MAGNLWVSDYLVVRAASTDRALRRPSFFYPEKFRRIHGRMTVNASVKPWCRSASATHHDCTVRGSLPPARFRGGGPRSRWRRIGANLDVVRLEETSAEACRDVLPGFRGIVRITNAPGGARGPTPAIPSHLLAVLAIASRHDCQFLEHGRFVVGKRGERRGPALRRGGDRHRVATRCHFAPDRAMCLPPLIDTCKEFAVFAAVVRIGRKCR